MEKEKKEKLLASAFDSLVPGVKIVAPGDPRIAETLKRGGVVKTFDIGFLHECTLRWHLPPHPQSMESSLDKLKLSSDANFKDYSVSVRSLSGETTRIDGISPSASISSLQAAIKEKTGVTDQQILISAGKQLEDGKTLEDYRLPSGSVICYVNKPLLGGEDPVLELDPSIFDHKYDFDFTDMANDGTKYKRGGKAYIRPYGWQRFAVNVKDKYSDTTWLGGTVVENRTENRDGEWPVSYHGLKDAPASVEPISKDGYDLDKCERELHGWGIYSTPNPDIADIFATQFKHEGQFYRIVMQNRVKFPAAGTEFILTDYGMEYYVNTIADNIRPYGILIQQEDEEL